MGDRAGAAVDARDDNDTEACIAQTSESAGLYNPARLPVFRQVPQIKKSGSRTSAIFTLSIQKKRRSERPCKDVRSKRLPLHFCTKVRVYASPGEPILHNSKAYRSDCDIFTWYMTNPSPRMHHPIHPIAVVPNALHEADDGRPNRSRLRLENAHLLPPLP